MRSIRTFTCALLAAALSACGGAAGGGTLPFGGDGTTRAAQSSTVAFEQKTLWVATPLHVDAYSTKGNGAVTPLAEFTGNGWKATAIGSGAPEDVAVAPDGTVWVLLGNGVDGGPNRSTAWRLVAYAPGETNLGHHEVKIEGSGYPGAIAIGGEGVLVQSGYTITTYPYATNNASALRTFRISPDHSGPFAVGNNGRIYLARTDGTANNVGFDSYSPESDGSTPVERINVAPTLGVRGMLAVGPDNSIYAEDLINYSPQLVPGPAQLYVNVYPPGSGTLARRIGPLPTPNFSDKQAPVIAVDALNRLYVATPGTIYRFAPDANGAAVPQRLMTTPELGYPRGMAVGGK